MLYSPDSLIGQFASQLTSRRQRVADSGSEFSDLLVAAMNYRAAADAAAEQAPARLRGAFEQVAHQAEQLVIDMQKAQWWEYDVHVVDETLAALEGAAHA